MEKIIIAILISVVILFVVFLILRELNCWYWKINEGIGLMKHQNSLLEKIYGELRRNHSSDLSNEEKARLFDERNGKQSQ